MRKIKITAPRTREDWTFYFQLFGFFGNIIFCIAVLMGAYGRKNTTPDSRQVQQQVIVIDSTWAAKNYPVIYDNRDEVKPK